MATSINRKSSIAAAGVAALLLGLGLGLFLFRGRGVPTQTSEASKQDGSNATPACTGQRQISLPDEAPESGPPLAALLQNAVALYFVCPPPPIEQLSRVFATLSVVVAQYVSDPGCFKGDKEAMSTNWSDDKAWADGQGRADPLMVNLRSKIGNALACLQPDQQRLFYVDMARAFTFAAAGHAMQTFVNPVFKGERVDRCLNYGRDCDGPAALAWCRRFGYSRITKWEWLNAPRTVTLGDQKSCTGSCGAFTSIVCAL